MHKSIKQLGLIAPALALLVLLGGVSLAANTPTLNQTISAGTSGAFSETGTIVSSITLMHAGGTAQGTWNGYLTGATVSQSVPAQTPTGSYSLPMTLTVVNS
jgi:hypothetical protein